MDAYFVERREASFSKASRMTPTQEDRMQSKWLSGVIVAAAAALWPASASACDFYLAYGPMGLQAGQFAIGGALLYEPGEEDLDGTMILQGDLGIRAGERFVVHPAIGYCSFGDDSEISFGGGAAVSLITNDQWSLGVQSHLAYTGFEGGVSEMSIPVVAAATFDVSETARLFANFGLRFSRLSFDDEDFESETESDPTASAGITLPAGPVQLSGGIILVNGDDDTDFAFGGSVQFGLGG